MNELLPFAFEGHPVRVQLDANGTPLFVARDVVEAVGAVWKMSASIGHVPEIWRGTHPISTPGGTQQMAVLTEQGVYFYLGRSDKPAALPIQMWLAGEVLPQIRKTGSYGAAPRPLTQLEALKQAVAGWEAAETRAIEAETAALTFQGERDAALAQYEMLESCLTQYVDLSQRGPDGEHRRVRGLTLGRIAKLGSVNAQDRWLWSLVQSDDSVDLGGGLKPLHWLSSNPANRNVPYARSPNGEAVAGTYITRVLQNVAPHSDGSPRMVWTPVFMAAGIVRLEELLRDVPLSVKNAPAHAQLERNRRRQERKRRAIEPTTPGSDTMH